jgi:hypothetical protein
MQAHGARGLGSRIERWPCVSLLQAQGAAELMPAVVAAYDKWDSRAPTGKINYLVSRLAVSLVGTGGATGLDRVKYITQVGGWEGGYGSGACLRC